MRQPGPALLQPKRPLTGWKSGAEDFPLSKHPPSEKGRAFSSRFVWEHFGTDGRPRQLPVCWQVFRTGHSEELSSWLEQDHRP